MFVVPCFNRYIVECKFITEIYTIIVHTCFNRYIVECKYLLKASVVAPVLVLIDT